MMNRLTSALVVSAAILCAAATAPCRAEPAPAQKFNPAACQYDDKDCITGWYNEYSSGILGEFKYYSAQQDFVAEMLHEPNETLINARLALLMIEGGMRFDQWVALKDDEAAKLAGLDLAKYHTISGECRDAVESMRASLLDLRRQRGKVPAEMAKYLKDAKVCERVFAIPAPRPKPAAPQAEDDDADAGASPRPLVITPAKAKKQAR